MIRLTVKGVEIPPGELHKYTLRFYCDPDDHSAPVPVLYKDGKRVSKGFALTVEAVVPPDATSSPNANCAD